MKSYKKITQYDYQKRGEKFQKHIRESDVVLRTDENIVIHADGVKFTSRYFKCLGDSSKKLIVEAMSRVTKRICEEYEGAVIGYTYGDEFSIILNGEEVSSNYHNRIQKLCSCIASKATLYFVQELTKDIYDEFKELIQNAVFACKVYNLPKNLTSEYMHWRQLSCSKMIYDRRENFESKEDWEKFGFVVVYEEEWRVKCFNFADKSFKQTPQNKFYAIFENK